MSRLLVVSATSVLLACSTSTGGTTSDSGKSCPSDAANAMLTDTSGSALASRVRESQASDEEVRITAGVLAYLAVSTAEQEMSVWFVRSRLFAALTDAMSRTHPGAWSTCNASSTLSARSIVFARPSIHTASCGETTSCAPSLAALADCFDGALELTFASLVKSIPLDKLRSWTGLMDETAQRAHAVGGDVLTAMKGALPPLVESRDLVDRFAQLIAEAQLIAGAAAIVGVPDEPVLLVLGTLGTAVSAYKCARNVHAVAGFVEGCLESNRGCSTGSTGGTSQRCEAAGAGGVGFSQCDTGKYAFTCGDGSTPSGCSKSAGFGANGGILCCDHP